MHNCLKISIKYRVTPANTPRWDLRRRSQKKIEGVGVIFPQLLCYLPLCCISIVL